MIDQVGMLLTLDALKCIKLTNNATLSRLKVFDKASLSGIAFGSKSLAFWSAFSGPKWPSPSSPRYRAYWWRRLNSQPLAKSANTWVDPSHISLINALGFVLTFAWSQMKRSYKLLLKQKMHPCGAPRGGYSIHWTDNQLVVQLDKLDSEMRLSDKFTIFYTLVHPLERNFISRRYWLMSGLCQSLTRSSRKGCIYSHFANWW